MAKRKQGNRLKERIGLTAQLILGQDDDLISWWDSIPPGEGQSAIKSALRYALGLPDERDALIARQRADLEAQESAAAQAFEALRVEMEAERRQRAADMTTMQNALAGYARLLQQVSGGNGEVQELADRLQQIERAYADELNRQAQWIDYLKAAFDGRVNVTPVDIPPQQQIEVVETIDDEQAQQRTKRLKKSQW